MSVPIEQFDIVGPIFPPDVSEDGETVYTFLVKSKDAEGMGALNVGQGILFEPSGFCAVNIGTFPLSQYAEAYALYKNDGTQPNTAYGTAYGPVRTADIEPFRAEMQSKAADYLANTNDTQYLPVV